MTLEVSIAKFNLGEMSITQFPKIAMEQIENGIESESLIILAGMGEKDSAFEIKEYLDAAIDELNITIYKSNEAAYILANYYVQECKNGNLHINEAIYKIKNECWESDLVKITSEKYIYDSIKFEKIIGSWYEYNEIDEFIDWVKKSKKSIPQINEELEEELYNNLLHWENNFLKSKLEQIKKH